MVYVYRVYVFTPQAPGEVPLTFTSTLVHSRLSFHRWSPSSCTLPLGPARSHRARGASETAPRTRWDPVVQMTQEEGTRQLGRLGPSSLQKGLIFSSYEIRASFV